MSPDRSPSSDPRHDELRLEDLPAKPVDKPGIAAVKGGGPHASPKTAAAGADDEVIRIEDLTPRENVKGGRKVILGEVATRPEEPK